MSSKSNKPKRSMISEGILSQINTIGQASDDIAPPPGQEKKRELVEKKGQGRPAVKPPCSKITLELPDDLLERLRLAAIEKTGGNRTMLIERILKGETTL